MLLDNVALLIESIARAGESRVEHWSFAIHLWLCFFRPHPSDVRSAKSANRQVRSSNRADDDRALRLAVDANRRAETRAIIIGTDIEDVAMARIAFEVNQVNSTLRLRLN